MTYEGGGSINGPFLGMLGASAAMVSIIAGVGVPRLCLVRQAARQGAARSGAGGTHQDRHLMIARAVRDVLSGSRRRPEMI